MPLESGSYVVGTRVVLTQKGEFGNVEWSEAGVWNPFYFNESYCCEGTIMKRPCSSSGIELRVDWDNGNHNTYAPEHLDLVGFDKHDIPVTGKNVTSGDQVRIVSLERTEECHGLTDLIRRLLGTIQTVSRVYPDRGCVAVRAGGIMPIFQFDDIRLVRNMIPQQQDSPQKSVKSKHPSDEAWQDPLAALRDVLPDVYGRKEHKKLMREHRFREWYEDHQKELALGHEVPTIMNQIKRKEDLHEEPENTDDVRHGYADTDDCRLAHRLLND